MFDKVALSRLIKSLKYELMYNLTMWWKVNNRNIAPTTNMISACCRQFVASRHNQTSKCASLNKRPPHYNNSRFDVDRRRSLAASLTHKVKSENLLYSCDFLILSNRYYTTMNFDSKFVQPIDSIRTTTKPPDAHLYQEIFHN